MKQASFYKYTTLVLLGINLILIAFLIIGNPERRNSTGKLDQQIISILELDQQQTALFKESATTHAVKVDSLGSEQKALLGPYFQSLTDSEFSHSSEDIQEIMALEEGKLKATYLHFQEVKNLLRPEQEGNFEAFVDLILRRMMGGRPPRKP